MSLPPREVIAGSPAVRGGAFVFVSGLTAFDRGTTATETRQILENLEARSSRPAGSSLDHVVKVNVLLHSMLEAPNMNEIYMRFFHEPPPARTVCGARLPDGVKVMIECTALRRCGERRLRRKTWKKIMSLRGGRAEPSASAALRRWSPSTRCSTCRAAPTCRTSPEYVSATTSSSPVWGRSIP